MTWRIEGRLSIVVHGPLPPSNLDWSGYLRDTLAADVKDLRVLVVSLGGSPDGKQRSELASSLQGRVSPTALLSDRVLVRGVVAALAWFNPGMKAFRLDDMEAACGFLGLTPDETVRAKQLRAELERDLKGDVRSVDAMR